MERWFLTREVFDKTTKIFPSTGVNAILRHRRRRATAAVVQAKHTTDHDRPVGEAAFRELLHANGRYDVRNPQLAQDGAVVAVQPFRGGEERAVVAVAAEAGTSRGRNGRAIPRAGSP